MFARGSHTFIQFVWYLIWYSSIYMYLKSVTATYQIFLQMKVNKESPFKWTYYYLWNKKIKKMGIYEHKNTLKVSFHFKNWINVIIKCLIFFSKFPSSKRFSKNRKFSFDGEGSILSEQSHYFFLQLQPHSD